jgi:hypothetical protein
MMVDPSPPQAANYRTNVAADLDQLLRRVGRRIEQFLAIHLIRPDGLLPLGRNQPIREDLRRGEP